MNDMLPFKSAELYRTIGKVKVQQIFNSILSMFWWCKNLATFLDDIQVLS